MARLAELPWGKLTSLVTKLGNAGLTVELAEKLSQNRALTRRVVEMVETSPQPPMWGPARYIKLTTDGWQEVAPSIRAMRSDGPGRIVNFQHWSSEGWSHILGTVHATDWWEFSPGVQLRNSPDYPGLTEFRHKA